jgi:hypothetical protein
VSITGAPASTQSVHRSYEPCRVRTGEYVNFHKQGFLLVRSLVRREDVHGPIDRMDNLLARRGPIPGSAVPSLRQSTQEKLQYWLRVHMLHRVLPFHARFLPHVKPHFGTPYVAIQPRTPVSRSCGGKPMSMMDGRT